MSDDRLNRIEDKLDKVLEKASSTDVTLAKQSVILEEHMRRTEALEAIVIPIKSKVDVVMTIIKLLGASSLGGGAIHGLLHYLLKVY